MAHTPAPSPSLAGTSVRLSLWEVSLPKGLARPVSTSSCSKTMAWDQEQTKAAQHSNAHAFFVLSQRWDVSRHLGYFINQFKMGECRK